VHQKATKIHFLDLFFPPKNSLDRVAVLAVERNYHLLKKQTGGAADHVAIQDSQVIGAQMEASGLEKRGKEQKSSRQDYIFNLV